jgi:acetylornithine/N-succinyldiaminopimelate aminotransferase
MNLFDVYPLYDIEPVKGLGCKIWDDKGSEYLDFYGGHAVISIGHSHPHYIKRIADQLGRIGFYSNSVRISMQQELAGLLGELSGYPNYHLFLSNSGAEANENALKLASFHTGRSKVVAFTKAFHGRTSGAVACTHNPKIIAPFNANHNVEFVPFNDIEATRAVVAKGDVAAVIIEGIQGVGGIQIPDNSFLIDLQKVCNETGTALILDEIQSGYGRSGKFFAHQYAGITPDIITVAKGMANGFPVGGVLISPTFEAKHGMLGTTFGGNHLACAASIAVLEVIRNENLIENARAVGDQLMAAAVKLPGLKEVRGRGVMIGMEFDFPIANIRKKLLFEHKIFTGVSGTNVIRLLPPLCITSADADRLMEAMGEVLR